jgi:hypothetical protein
MDAASAQLEAARRREAIRFHKGQVASHRKKLRREAAAFESLCDMCERLGINLNIETKSQQEVHGGDSGTAGS